MTALTILIPTTGNLNKLKVNLLFLIKQTSKDFKVIIGNNSPKNIEPFLNTFRKQLKIKLYDNKRDIGFARNLHNLISKVKTKYFLMCSDDDYLLPRAIKETLDIFKNFPNCSTVRLGYVETQDNRFLDKNYINTYYRKTFSKKIILIKSKISDVKSMQIIKNLDNFSGIAFRGSCFKHYKYMGICTCYVGNVLQNTKKKDYIFLDKPLIIMTRGNLNSLSNTSNIMDDKINFFSNKKEFKNLLLLYIRKYYFNYLLVHILNSNKFLYEYKNIENVFKIGFFQKNILFFLNMILTESIKKNLIILIINIKRNFSKKKKYYFK
jgi:hypothetical protein